MEMAEQRFIIDGDTSTIPVVSQASSAKHNNKAIDVRTLAKKSSGIDDGIKQWACISSLALPLSPLYNANDSSPLVGDGCNPNKSPYSTSPLQTKGTKASPGNVDNNKGGLTSPLHNNKSSPVGTRFVFSGSSVATISHDNDENNNNNALISTAQQQQENCDPREGRSPTEEQNRDHDNNKIIDSSSERQGEEDVTGGSGYYTCSESIGGNISGRCRESSELSGRNLEFLTDVLHCKTRTARTTSTPRTTSKTATERSNEVVSNYADLFGCKQAQSSVVSDHNGGELPATLSGLNKDFAKEKKAIVDLEEEKMMLQAEIEMLRVQQEEATIGKTESEEEKKKALQRLQIAEHLQDEKMKHLAELENSIRDLSSRDRTSLRVQTDIPITPNQQKGEEHRQNGENENMKHLEHNVESKDVRLLLQEKKQLETEVWQVKTMMKDQEHQTINGSNAISMRRYPSSQARNQEIDQEEPEMDRSIDRIKHRMALVAKITGVPSKLCQTNDPGMQEVSDLSQSINQVKQRTSQISEGSSEGSSEMSRIERARMRIKTAVHTEDWKGGTGTPNSRGIEYVETPKEKQVWGKGNTPGSRGSNQKQKWRETEQKTPVQVGIEKSFHFKTRSKIQNIRGMKGQEPAGCLDDQRQDQDTKELQRGATGIQRNIEDNNRSLTTNSLQSENAERKNGKITLRSPRIQGLEQAETRDQNQEKIATKEHRDFQVKLKVPKPRPELIDCLTQSQLQMKGKRGLIVDKNNQKVQDFIIQAAASPRRSADIQQEKCEDDKMLQKDKMIRLLESEKLALLYKLETIRKDNQSKLNDMKNKCSKELEQIHEEKQEVIKSMAEEKSMILNEVEESRQKIEEEKKVAIEKAETNFRESLEQHQQLASIRDLEKQDLILRLQNETILLKEAQAESEKHRKTLSKMEDKNRQLLAEINNMKEDSEKLHRKEAEIAKRHDLETSALTFQLSEGKKNLDELGRVKLELENMLKKEGEITKQYEAEKAELLCKLNEAEKELSGRNTSTFEELAGLKGEKKGLEAELEGLKRRNENLVKELTKSQKETLQKVTCIEAEKKELKALQQELKDYNTKVAKNDTRREAEKKELLAEIDKLKDTMGRYQREAEDAKKDNHVALTKVSLLEEEKKAMVQGRDKEKEELLAEINQLTQDISNWQREVDDAKGNSSSALARIAFLEAKKKELIRVHQEEKKELQAEYNQKIACFDDVKDALVEAKQELVESNKNLMAKNDSLVAEKLDLQTEIDKLKDDIYQTHREAEDFKEHNNMALVKVAQLDFANAELRQAQQTEKDALLDKIEKLNNAINENNAEKGELATAQQKLERHNSNILDRVKHLEDEKAALNTAHKVEKDKLLAELNQLKEVNKKTSEKVVRIEKEREKLSVARENLTEYNKTTTGKLARLELETKDLRAEKEAMKEVHRVEKEAILAELDHLTKEIGDCRKKTSENIGKEKLLNNFKQEFDQCKEDALHKIAGFEEEKDKLNVANQELAEENKKFSKKIARLQAEKEELRKAQEAEKDVLLAQVTRLKLEIDVLEDQEQSKEENWRKIARFEVEKKDLDIANQILTEHNKKMFDKIARLEAEKEDLRKEQEVEKDVLLSEVAKLTLENGKYKEASEKISPDERKSFVQQSNEAAEKCKRSGVQQAKEETSWVKLALEKVARIETEKEQVGAEEIQAETLELDTAQQELTKFNKNALDRVAHLEAKNEELNEAKEELKKCKEEALEKVSCLQEEKEKLLAELKHLKTTTNKCNAKETKFLDHPNAEEVLDVMKLGKIPSCEKEKKVLLGNLETEKKALLGKLEQLKAGTTGCVEQEVHADEGEKLPLCEITLDVKQKSEHDLEYSSSEIESPLRGGESSSTIESLEDEDPRQTTSQPGEHDPAAAKEAYDPKKRRTIAQIEAEQHKLRHALDEITQTMATYEKYGQAETDHTWKQLKQTKEEVNKTMERLEGEKKRLTFAQLGQIKSDKSSYEIVCSQEHENEKLQIQLNKEIQQKSFPNEGLLLLGRLEQTTSQESFHKRGEKECFLECFEVESADILEDLEKDKQEIEDFREAQRQIRVRLEAEKADILKELFQVQDAEEEEKNNPMEKLLLSPKGGDERGLEARFEKAEDGVRETKFDFAENNQEITAQDSGIEVIPETKPEQEGSEENRNGEDSCWNCINGSAENTSDPILDTVAVNYLCVCSANHDAVDAVDVVAMP